jgi:DNA-binding NarL/FixJ family response regulator
MHENRGPTRSQTAPLAEKRNGKSPIRLYICCRVYLFAESLKLLLEEDDQFEIAGVVCDEDDLREILPLGKEVVIADYVCCGKIIKDIQKNHTGKILLINDYPDLCISYVDLQEMVARGLGGIMPNNSDSSILKKAIIALDSGELWIDHKTITNLLYKNGDEKHPVNLTKKETEILHYICNGYSNKSIAQKLCISEQTVKSHCNHLFKKFGVPNRVKLALSASRTSSHFFRHDFN